MSYVPPDGLSIDFSWVGAPPYAAPAGNALNFQWPAAARKTITASTRAPWSTSEGVLANIDAPMQASLREDAGASMPWIASGAQDTTENHRWGVAATQDRAARAPWLMFTEHPQSRNRVPWVTSERRDDASGAPWGRYERWLQVMEGAPWRTAVRADEASRAPWAGRMPHADLLRKVPQRAGAKRDQVRWVPWAKFSRTLQFGIGVIVPPDDGTPSSLVVVPVKRVYMQVNNVSLARLADSAPIKTHSLRVSLDRESWTWSFTAALPATERPLVERTGDEPVTLRAMVNGMAFHLIVERMGRDRAFGQTSFTISGRGVNALLDAPYAATQNFGNSAPRTIQQLMSDVLTVGGVSMGWTVNFAPTDWTVPADVFAHRGSYISALNQLAAAAGAYLQPHASEQELFVLPIYPTAPWEWAGMDTDYELPADVVTREGTDWFDKPVYNRVYVSGVQDGVLGRVTRAGTAGDLVAETIVDPLITHADAARQRGLPVLADTGSGANVTLRMPVLTETGIIVPGKTLRYVDDGETYVGIVRGVALDASFPEVWQTLTVETR